MDYYDSISEGYEELHKEEQLKKVDIIKKEIALREEDKLLDVGCGTGLTTEAWRCKKYGIDPAKKLIRKAEEKVKKRKGEKRDRDQDKNNIDEIEYKVAPAEDIPYPDDFFDIVISVTAIQNFSDIAKGLDEIKRVGKERFVLSFLKRSAKKEEIKDMIIKRFNIKKQIEEEKDIIFFT